MSISIEQIKTNRILAGLPAGELDLLIPSLEMNELPLGEVLANVGKPITRLYFPLNSAISIVNQQEDSKDTRIVEVTVIGKEGCSGATIVQGSDTSPSVALVQVGGTAIEMPTASVTRFPARLPYLWKALLRYSLLLYRHSVISVGCSQFHSSSQRVARWLKAHWHRTGLETFPFSTGFFAAQVGINEKTVAEVLDEFERAGILQLERNTIGISNQHLLTQQSCPCYELAKEAVDEYLVALIEVARSYGNP